MLPSRYPRELQESEAKSGTWWEHPMPKRGPATYRFDIPMGVDFSVSVGSAERWSENTFENCIVATDICSMGLVLMQRTKIPPANVTALARGLYCTLFAAGIVGARNFDLNTQNSLMDAEDGGNTEFEKHLVHVLASNLSRCAAEALTLSLSLTDGNETDQRISAAVAANRKALRFLTGDTRDYVCDLCSELNA